MERHPRHNAGSVRRGENVPVVPDGISIMVALVGLEAGPLDGQPVMGEAKGGQQAEVLGVSSREPVPVTR
jgi:hypothetical protein